MNLYFAHHGCLAQFALMDTLKPSGRYTRNGEQTLYYKSL